MAGAFSCMGSCFTPSFWKPTKLWMALGSEEGNVQWFGSCLKMESSLALGSKPRGKPRDLLKQARPSAHAWCGNDTSQARLHAERQLPVVVNLRKTANSEENMNNTRFGGCCTSRPWHLFFSQASMTTRTECMHACDWFLPGLLLVSLPKRPTHAPGANHRGCEGKHCFRCTRALYQTRRSDRRDRRLGAILGRPQIRRWVGSRFFSSRKPLLFDHEWSFMGLYPEPSSPLFPFSWLPLPRRRSTLLPSHALQFSVRTKYLKAGRFDVSEHQTTNHLCNIRTIFSLGMLRPCDVIKHLALLHSIFWPRMLLDLSGIECSLTWLKRFQDKIFSDKSSSHKSRQRDFKDFHWKITPPKPVSPSGSTPESRTHSFVTLDACKSKMWLIVPQIVKALGVLTSNTFKHRKRCLCALVQCCLGTGAALEGAGAAAGAGTPKIRFAIWGLCFHNFPSTLKVKRTRAKPRGRRNQGRGLFTTTGRSLHLESWRRISCRLWINNPLHLNWQASLHGGFINQESPSLSGFPYICSGSWKSTWLLSKHTEKLFLPLLPGPYLDL